MLSLIKGEFFKIHKNKSFKLVIFFSVVMSIIFYIYISLSNYMKPQNTINGIAMFYLLLSPVSLLNFFSALVSVALICKDFENKTIYMSFTYGYNRLKILLSKFFVYLTCSTFVIYVFIFSSTIIFSFFYGFGQSFNLYSVYIILKSIIANLIGIITISTITFLISIISKNTIITTISPIIIYFIYMVISYFDNSFIHNLLPFDLVINALNNHVTFIDISKLALSFLLTSLISLSICIMHIKNLELV